MTYLLSKKRDQLVWVTELNMILLNKLKMYPLQISIKLRVSSKVINNNIRDSFSE